MTNNSLQLEMGVDPAIAEEFGAYLQAIGATREPPTATPYSSAGGLDLSQISIAINVALSVDLNVLLGLIFGYLYAKKSEGKQFEVITARGDRMRPLPSDAPELKKLMISLALRTTRTRRSVFPQ